MHPASAKYYGTSCDANVTHNFWKEDHSLPLASAARKRKYHCESSHWTSSDYNYRYLPLHVLRYTQYSITHIWPDSTFLCSLFLTIAQLHAIIYCNRLFHLCNFLICYRSLRIRLQLTSWSSLYGQTKLVDVTKAVVPLLHYFRHYPRGYERLRLMN